MAINAGERVVFHLVSEATLRHATIVSVDDAFILIKPEYDAPGEIEPGRYLLLSEPDTDIEYYAEVVGSAGATLRLKRMWTGRRGYFRVDDVFPLTWRKAELEALPGEAKIFTGSGVDAAGADVPDEMVNPKLWKMLLDMNAKLDMVLQHLSLEREGLVRSESMPVNISASGIRFNVYEPVSIGDVLELKLLLPACPPVGIRVNARVVRIDEHEQAGYQVSLHFIQVNDEVREVIIRYTLKRQRELIRRQRKQE